MKTYFAPICFVILVFAKFARSARHFEVETLSVNNKNNDRGENATQVVLWGHGFTSGLQIALTTENGVKGKPCLEHVTPIDPDALGNTHASFTILPTHIQAISELGQKKIWVCAKARHLNGARARHMGKDGWIHLGSISSMALVPSQEQNATFRLSSLLTSGLSGANEAVRKQREGGMAEEESSRTSGMEKRDTNGKATSTPEELVLRSPRSSVDELIEEGKERYLFTNLSSLNSNDSFTTVRPERVPSPQQIYPVPMTSGNSSLPSLNSNASLRVTSLRVEAHEKGVAYDDYAGSVLVDTDVDIRFFGYGFMESTEFLFTSYEGEFGAPCGTHTTKAFSVNALGNNWATATIKLPTMTANQTHWFLCAREGPQHRAYHQGIRPWLTMKSYNLILPVWIQALFIVVLLCLSGIFSGLNLGLMALDKTDLKILAKTGSLTEQGYAKRIEPVRAHGNYLLCTLLLGNVLVNSTLTILLDGLSTGLIAVIGSTIGIVLFGEIFPQAVCSRHGLAVGARTVWLVKIFMVLTGLMSWPISKILDFVLGEEIGNTYNRERLKELIKLTQGKTDLKAEEQKVICAALDFHNKTVAEVMTKLNDMYMLSIDASLNFDTINEMMQQGYSRIPVYEDKRTNIVSVLFIKDLAFIDPDDNTPLKTLCQFYQNPLNFVHEETTLDVMLKDFKGGIKGHMAFVHIVNKTGDGDPFYEVIGLVTLEDVIEELIQEEIVDETDVFTDNRKRHRRDILGRRDFTEFSQSGNQTNTKKPHITSQMQVAAFQYMRTSIDPFKEGQLSEAVVKRLINQDIVHSIKVNNKEESKSDMDTYIYIQGKPADYFVLILEGHIEVLIGKEGLTFVNGPFTYFGLAALPQVQGIGESPLVTINHSRRGSIRSIQSLDSTSSSFVPDYSVRAISDVLYLKISCSHYVAARRAFLLELSQKKPCDESVIKESTQECTESPDRTPVASLNNKNSLGIATQIDPPSPLPVSHVKKAKPTAKSKQKESRATVNFDNPEVSRTHLRENKEKDPSTTL